MSKKVSGIFTLFKDAVVTPPTPQSGEGSFGSVVDTQGPTEQPVKPVQFANIKGADTGSVGFGPKSK